MSSSGLCTDLTSVRQSGGGLTAHPIYCRCWQCDICHPRRCAELRRLARAGSPTTFITLTSNPSWGETPHERAQALVKAWRNMRQTLERTHGCGRIPFLAIFERTTRGEPHLHIVARAPYISQAWLSEHQRRYMDAPIVDIRRVRSQKGIGKYVSKYVAKDPRVYSGCKRYFRSQNWQIEDDDQAGAPRDHCVAIWKNLAEVKKDVSSTGITIAETVKGDWIKVLWWIGKLEGG